MDTFKQVEKRHKYIILDKSPMHLVSHPFVDVSLVSSYMYIDLYM